MSSKCLIPLLRNSPKNDVKEGSHFSANLLFLSPQFDSIRHMKCAIIVLQERYCSERTVNMNNKEDIEKVSLALEIVAAVNGVSVDEVKSEIAAAFLMARNSEDPAVKKKWEEIMPDGQLSLEETIAVLAKQMKGEI